MSFENPNDLAYKKAKKEGLFDGLDDNICAVFANGALLGIFDGLRTASRDAISPHNILATSPNYNPPIQQVLDR